MMAWDSLENVGADIKTQGDSTKNDNGKTSAASFPDQSVYMTLSSRGPLIGPREIMS